MSQGLEDDEKVGTSEVENLKNKAEVSCHS